MLDVLADILGDGKASRLYSHLVYDQQVAQDVSASQSGTELAGTLAIDITAKPDIPLGTIERSVDDILQTIMHHGVTEEEVERSMNNREAQLVHRLSSTLGKASGLATSHTLWGNASLYNKELERFAGISPTDVKDVARKVFTGHHVVLSAVPKRKTSLAAMPAVALGESKGHKH